MASAPHQPVASAPRIVTSDDLRWEREAADNRHLAVQRVQEVASRWLSATASILGVASLLGLTVPQEDVGWSQWVGLGTMISLVLALTGLVAASYASQGAPAYVPYSDGAVLREMTLRRARRSATLLRVSRWFIVAAAGALAATVALQVASPAEDDAAEFLVTYRSGEVACGPIPEVLPEVPARPVKLITPVDACE